MSASEDSTVAESKADVKTEVKEEKTEKPSITQNNDFISIEIPTDVQCYCGRQRDFKEPDFQCSACYKWFHQKCIIFNVGNALPFMTNYHFMCKNCNQANEEVFSRKQANFAVMCQTALANLTFQHNGQLYFSNENSVIPFLEQHWEVLTTQPRRTNKSWYANINKTLASNESLFKTKEESGDLKVCLANTDLAKMGPSYDRFRALASQLKTDISKLGIPATGGGNSRKRKAGLMSGGGGGVGLGVGGSTGTSLAASLATGGLGGVEPGTALAGAQLAKSRRQPEEGRTRLNQYGFPIEHPFNKDGYRYILVEPDPHAPGRQTWDECDLTAGKPIPGYFYRLYLSPKVLFSTIDRAHQLKLHESQLSVTGDRGYSMIRATHSVCRGTWYFELTIKEQAEGSHTRLGWSQMLGTMQAPCGYDRFSYSWRSRRGTAFHASKGHHYTEKGYEKGDVIGCMIHLPEVSENGDKVSTSESLPPFPDTYKERPLIKFKNSYYFEEKDEFLKTEKELREHAGSKIVFFKNGECQGTAFSNISMGNYYPAISLYKTITVAANFGPDFEHPPSNITSPDYCRDWKPMSDRVQSLEVEQTLSDLLHLVDKADQVDPLLASL